MLTPLYVGFGMIHAGYHEARMPPSSQASHRRGPQTVVGIAALIGVLAGLKLAASIVVPMLFAAFFAMAMWPLANWLQSFHMSRSVAAGLAALAGVGAVAALGAAISSAVHDFGESLPQYLDRLEGLQQSTADWFRHRGLYSVAHPIAGFHPKELSDNLFASGITAVADTLSFITLLMVLLLFMLLEAASLPQKLQTIAEENGVELRHLHVTVRDVQRYLWLKTLMSLITGVLVGLWVWAWGVDHALLWGVLGFALNYVPAVGSIIAAGPPVALALLELGWGTAFAIGAGYLVVNMLIGNFLEPRVEGPALGLSPLVVVISIVVWGFVLGPLGAFLSVPLTMIVRLVLSRSESLSWVAVLLAPPIQHPAPPPGARPPPRTWASEQDETDEGSSPTPRSQDEANARG